LLLLLLVWLDHPRWPRVLLLLLLEAGVGVPSCRPCHSMLPSHHHHLLP
jgi:hypothetical protein